MFCPVEGVWERTLAGLTIPGPCPSDKYGASSRTCAADGTWAPVDYAGCFDKGCPEDDGWSAVPVGMTLRRDCAPGYRGYRYRYCADDGEWNPVDEADCGGRAAGGRA